MFAAEKWSRCNTRDTRIYIWTAGQWENPSHKSRFVWRNAGTLWKNMHYTNWMQEYGHNQPDNYGGNGNENCVNLWPKFAYKWNDEPCSNRYCFVCEDLSAGSYLSLIHI